MSKVFRYRDMHTGTAQHFNIVESVSGVEAFPRHTHEFIELVIVTGGTAIHQARRLTHPIKAGDVYVIHPGVNHALKDMRGLVQCHISFDPSIYLAPYARLLGKLPGYHALFVIDRKNPGARFTHHFRLPAGCLARLRPLLDQLMECQKGESPAKDARTFGLFAQVVVLLCESFQKENATAKYPVARLARTISHMENHYTEALKLDELARMSHLSMSQFSRIFRDNYGTSPMDYIIRRRIEHACRLMRDPELSITQIAFRSGFNDSNYFFRQFKRVMGHSAREFRKKP
ncbi:helix-turn-helix domain-containing protein [Oscillatoria laete-virens NRMC-F 0139]|nr:helix-turn-helix domain-containing protein [Oscillatoria laete-virens]MDL5055235.1 helix-turn-helix domain-containing protein [Oscillatoria laete-virens NRMC-F 0139]